MNATFGSHHVQHPMQLMTQGSFVLPTQVMKSPHLARMTTAMHKLGENAYFGKLLASCLTWPLLPPSAFILCIVHRHDLCRSSSACGPRLVHVSHAVASPGMRASGAVRRAAGDTIQLLCELQTRHLPSC